MCEYSQMSKQQLEELREQLQGKYEAFKKKGLNLDMSRGKPGKEQLDISNKLLDNLNSKSSFKSMNGFDCRNYGVLDGIGEMKAIFSELMEVPTQNIIVCGNSSLNIMYDYIAQCMIFGAGEESWLKQGNVKFACPVPGYDRHFAILEHFGIEMLSVPMTDNGPNMDVLEELIKDSSVKGVFCVPKYSNPQGITFSAETVRRFAALKPAAKDFRVIWDNAYIVHDINDTPDTLENIFYHAKEFGSEDYFIEVTSTSKVSFPGAGVSALAASDNNIAEIKKRMSIQTIGHDKLNQLRHMRFFINTTGIIEHMKTHAAIVAPKFKAVITAFESEFANTGIAKWKNPNGGYFISLDVMNGCASRVGKLCKDAGVTLTPVGATFPYGKDPNDSNIRIAPTFPSVNELNSAVEVLCVCVKLAVVEKLLGE